MREPQYMVAVDTLDKAKRVAMWGTYGKDGKEPLRWIRLIDASTEHLQAILRTQPLGFDYREIIQSILADRAHDSNHN